MGHQEEGLCSNRPEISDFVLALCGTPVTKPMLYLCDNQAQLKAVKKWVGEGVKATLVGVPRADISLEALELMAHRAPKSSNIRVYLVCLPAKTSRMIYYGVMKASSITEFRKRTTAGTTMFMANGGEYANKIADIQANKAISGKHVSIEWPYKTNREAFTWQEPRRKDKEEARWAWKIESRREIWFRLMMLLLYHNKYSWLIFCSLVALLEALFARIFED